MGQFLHIWWCKTRTVSVFEHGIFNNRYINIGVIIEVAIVVFLIYVPPMQDIFLTNTMTIIYWLPFLGTGFLLFAYNESRKYFIKANPSSKLSQMMLW
jgi:magnesium-transporting ATPase (P-type)